MLTPERDGIICDLCGEALRNKFEYFSMSSSKVYVDKDRSDSGIINVEDDILDFEICPKCYREKLTNVILNNRKD